jgi:hypothetical protein
MEAFYLKVGPNPVRCADVPNSGILIQTPPGATKIELTINDVHVQLGSTAYLQAQVNGFMVINVVEGLGRSEAFDQLQFAPAGSRLRIPVNRNFIAAGAPVEAEPYDEKVIGTLPTGLLERTIQVSRALTRDEIKTVLSVPESGEWKIKITAVNGRCDDDVKRNIRLADGLTVEAEVNADATNIAVFGVSFKRTARGQYRFSNEKFGITLMIRSADYSDFAYLDHVGCGIKGYAERVGT